MRTPGFLNDLQMQLESLSTDQLDRINRRGGLEVRDLIDFTISPRDYTVHDPYQVERIHRVQPSKENCTDTLEAGETAVCLLVSEDDLKNRRESIVSHVSSLASAKFIWAVSPPSALDTVKSSLENYNSVVITPQFESICLTPDNQVYYESGEPVFHACGPGDAIPALKESGILDDFISSGGKNIIFYDMSAAEEFTDLSFLEDHVAAGFPVTCLTNDLKFEDSSPVVCEHEGFDQLVERFRFYSLETVMNFKHSFAGIMVVDASLDFDSVEWSWHRRKIRRNNKLVIQYMRYMQDITSTFKTRFVRREVS